MYIRSTRYVIGAGKAPLHWFKTHQQLISNFIQLALSQWRNHLFIPLQNDNSKLSGTVFRLIERERNGGGRRRGVEREVDPGARSWKNVEDWLYDDGNDLESGTRSNGQPSHDAYRY